MIHVHAEVARSIRNAMVRHPKKMTFISSSILEIEELFALFLKLKGKFMQKWTVFSFLILFRVFFSVV